MYIPKAILTIRFFNTCFRPLNIIMASALYTLLSFPKIILYLWYQLLTPFNIHIVLVPIDILFCLTFYDPSGYTIVFRVFWYLS